MLDLSSLIIYTALVAVGWITYKLYIYPYYISPLRKIPGPPTGNPIYGNIKPIFYEEGGETHFRWIKKYGNIVKYHELFNQPAILVTDAKIIQEIALSNGYDYYKPRGLRGDFESIIGHGIAFSEGEVHKRQRKMMNPAFTHHYIKNMVPTFSRVASTLINLLENKVNKGGSKVILSPYISKATLDVIGLVGFNHEFNSQTSPSDLATAYETIGPQLTDKLYLMIGVFAGFVPFIRKIPIDINKNFIKVRDVIGRVSVKLIEEKYQEDKYNKLNGTDLLSLLIKINKTLPIEDKLTELELRYQIMTFLFAGHETTSNATSWALYLLAQHPKEQELLREELVKAFPDKSKFNPTFDEINSLEYLNCIIKETLRLYPPVATLRRYNIKDKMFGEYLIPKGTTIDIPIVALHRLPSIWGSTADDFDPKRWLNPSLIENITNYNYLPFGTGLRSCIGNKLALSEFKILLSMLVRNFAFQPVEGFHIKREAGILIKPSPYLELTVSKVEV